MSKIESNLITLDRAEATTNWISNGFNTSPGTVDDPRIEGSLCVQARTSNTTAWSAFLTGVALDFTDGKRIFFWYNNTCPASTDTIVNGGIGMYVSSLSTISVVGSSPNNGPNDSKNWFFDGKNGNTLGGWTCFVYDPRSLATLTLGSPLLTGIKQIGLRNKTVSTIATSTRNIMWDVLRIGSGLIVSEGSAESPTTLQEIFDSGSLQSTMYGVLNKKNDIYFLNGQLSVGKSDQQLSSHFKDTNKTLVFPDFPVGEDFYEITCIGNTGQFNTSFQLGSYDGVNTSEGCTVKGAGKAMWSPLVKDNNSDIKIYNSVVSEIRTGIFNSSSQIFNSSINNSGPIIPSGCSLSGCSFNNATGLAAIYISTQSDISPISNCTFNNCRAGLLISATGTYNFNKLSFNNNIYDVINASTGQVNVNVVNGGNASVYTNTNGGTTTINNLVTLTLNGIISGSEVRIFSAGTITELGGIESLDGTAFNYQYNYSPGQNIDIVIFKEDYNYYRIPNYSLLSADGSVPISQTFDRVYA